MLSEEENACMHVCTPTMALPAFVYTNQICATKCMNVCHYHSTVAVTGFPRPIVKPRVPSGILGPGGCLADEGCSFWTWLTFEGGVPTG